MVEAKGYDAFGDEEDQTTHGSLIGGSLVQIVASVGYPILRLLTALAVVWVGSYASQYVCCCEYEF